MLNKAINKLYIIGENENIFDIGKNIKCIKKFSII